jgi:hypothetical protein
MFLARCGFLRDSDGGWHTQGWMHLLSTSLARGTVPRESMAFPVVEQWKLTSLKTRFIKGAQGRTFKLLAVWSTLSQRLIKEGGTKWISDALPSTMQAQAAQITFQLSGICVLTSNV